MISKVSFSFAACLLCAAAASAPAGDLRIDVPKDGQSAGDLLDIEGVVTGEDAEVWVIVHPRGTTEYWVQPSAGLGGTKDGLTKWYASAHIGRPGQDLGKRFQIRAVANPKVELKTGKVLYSWPRGESSSDVVNVVKAVQPD